MIVIGKIATRSLNKERYSERSGIGLVNKGKELCMCHSDYQSIQISKTGGAFHSSASVDLEYVDVLSQPNLLLDKRLVV